MNEPRLKFLIPGGSGQVGSILTRALMHRGHEVVVLSRRPGEGPARVVPWDGATAGAWTRELDSADVVINLAGRSVNCRYRPAYRKAILSSRVLSTRAIGAAITAAPRPPRLWLQASTATIYAHRFDVPHDERTGVIGGGEPGAPDTWRFSIDVAAAWEQTALDHELEATRLVLMRSAMTMSPDPGGVFDALLRLVRFGLGGTAASGRQYISWIHETDFVRAVLWLVDHEDVSGPVNLAAPEPLLNADFMRVLREAWGTKTGLPASRWMLEVGAFLMQTETELVLKSRRVVPGLLLERGFDFDFGQWAPAARNLCRRWREEQAAVVARHREGRDDPYI